MVDSDSKARPGIHTYILRYKKTTNSGPREMAQQLRTLAVFAGDPGCIPSTHIRWLTTT